MSKDPVCGMEVDANKKGVVYVKQGQQTFFFCSAACRWMFEADPQRYLKGGTLPKLSVR